MRFFALFLWLLLSIALSFVILLFQLLHDIEIIRRAITIEKSFKKRSKEIISKPEEKIKSDNNKGRNREMSKIAIAISKKNLSENWL